MSKPTKRPHTVPKYSFPGERGLFRLAGNVTATGNDFAQNTPELGPGLVSGKHCLCVAVKSGASGPDYFYRASDWGPQS